jgi:hypothetical protein
MKDQPLLKGIEPGPPEPSKEQPAKIELTPEGNAWRHRFNELADYVLAHMVNRTEIYERYRSDGRSYTAKGGLKRPTIEQHFRPITAADIIGLHSTLAKQIEGPDGPIVSCTNRWVCNDVDYHGVGDVPQAIVEAVKRWHSRACDLGFHPLTYQSNGRGGYRILIFFADPIQTAIAYSFIQWLQKDWRELGLDHEPEFFPRQRKIRLLDDPYDAKGACGNWVRLIGRHYKREHHTRFWTGERVLCGNAAIDLLLDHTGDDPSMIPAECLKHESGPTVGKAREAPKPAQPKSFVDLSLAADALRCLTSMASDYDAWLKIGMALYELGDVGLTLWDSWSQTSK